MSKKLKKELKKAKTTRDEKVKEVMGTRDKIVDKARDVLWTKIKNPILDAYEDAMAKLGNLEESKTSKEWTEFHEVEDKFFEEQRKVKLIEEEVKDTFRKVKEEAAKIYKKATEDIYDEYEMMVLGIKTKYS